VTLVDTNILLDVLLAGAVHGDESERRLAAALAAGPLGINHIIAAEIAPVFALETDLWDALAKAQIRVDPYPKDAVYVAGHAFLAYRRRGGTRQRILPDFMIAAHALTTGAELLTRDRGFYRKYFPRLRLSR
jgi:predicted nucleic acid-binding protein